MPGLRRSGAVIIGLLALLLNGTLATSQVAAQQAQQVQDAALFRFYPASGHNLGPPFKDFYDSHGGVDVFGLPLTEVLSADVLSSTATLSSTAAVSTTDSTRSTFALSATQALSTTQTQLRPLVFSSSPLHQPLVLRQEVALAAPEVAGDAGRVLVQYFERARLEYHPDAAATITVADLGRRLSANRSDLAFIPQQQPAAEAADVLFFAESSHNLRGSFRSFWQEHGGLEVFGYPLSELTPERDAGGGWVMMQYFERARLEYRPAASGNAAVQLGLLGREYLAQHPLSATLLAPVAPIVRLASASTPYYPGTPDATNILLAAQRLDGLVVEPGAPLSFLDSMGTISEQAGFVEGAGIVGDQIVPVLAGGICQVSSALYDAVFAAGFEIVERHNHSRLLGFFADRPGIEAAVYSPGQDLRWRNDSAFPIHIETSSDARTGLITLTLWGMADGRSTTVGAPQRGDEQEPAAAQWLPDDTLAAGEVQQSAAPQQGFSAGLERVVNAADGTLLHHDHSISVYEPVAEQLRYGQGIQPPSEESPACLLENTQPQGELAQALQPCNQPTPTAPSSTAEPTATPTTQPDPGSTPVPMNGQPLAP